MTDTVWQEPHVALTRRMWAEGRSASEIMRQLANDFGFVVSRSAVIGKIHRLKLPRAETKQARACDKSLKKKAAAGQIKRPAEPAPNRVSRFFLPPSPTPPPAPRPSAQCPPAPDCPAITILDLTSKTCRWPLERNEDGERLFCGGEVGKRDRHKRYCDHHRFRELQRSPSKAA